MTNARVPGTGLSRRGFLTGTAGLTFALSVPCALFTRPERALAQPGAEQHTFGAWVKIDSDGRIEIAFPAVEMGQGVMTALPMIIAEELDADWSKVTPFVPPPVAATYGNPAWGGILMSVGSKTVEGYWDKIRLQAAAARKVLVQAAAAQWGVLVEELRTEPSVVVHDASGRRITYAELAAVATVPTEMPKVDKSELKKSKDYSILGKPMPRFDIPPKSNGDAVFGIDVQVPGMVYATVLRCPVEGAKPDQIDARDAEQIPGVLKILPLQNAVGIVGDRVEAVFAARDALRVTWAGGAPQGYDSSSAIDEFAARAAKVEETGLSYVRQGDADGAFGRGAKVITAQYRTDYVYHAQMEPMNVTASVNEAGDAAEIWIGTQAQTATIGAAAALLNTTPDKIKLNEYYLGGGFGRRGSVDLIPDVLTLSKAMKRPVKLIWTRDQDVKAGKMRPMTAHHLQAAFDGDGNLLGWRHRLVAESVIAYRNEKDLEKLHGLDNIVLEGAKISYEVPHQSIAYVRERRGVGLSSWRGIGAGYNKFAIESFIDELASGQSEDPVVFRRRLLHNNPRALAVINAVAEMSGWGRKPAESHAFGFAFGQVVNSWTAGAVEISLDRTTGEIRAHQFWTAIDPGIVINPDTILAQTEGNVVFGLSQVLRERASFAGGEVEQSNFYDYPVVRMAEVPEIHVRIIPTDNPPTGIGEAALPLVGPAVANALYRLTGKRMRHMPLTPDRVLAALGTA